jgi:hypothetical protein
MKNEIQLVLFNIEITVVNLAIYVQNQKIFT